MVTTMKSEGSLAATTQNIYEILTIVTECLRCKNPAMVKGASSPLLSGPRISNLYVLTCPHCGYWEHVGRLRKENTVVIKNLLGLGFIKMHHPALPGYFSMVLRVSSFGTVVGITKTGDIRFDRLRKEVTDEDAKTLISSISSNHHLNKENCYISRWNTSENKLDILYGKMPVISERNLRTWENLLLSPDPNGDNSRYDGCIGILMHNDPHYLSLGEFEVRSDGLWTKCKDKMQY